MVKQMIASNIYIIGGSARDPIFLGKPPNDIDILMCGIDGVNDRRRAAYKLITNIIGSFREKYKNVNLSMCPSSPRHISAYINHLSEIQRTSSVWRYDFTYESGFTLSKGCGFQIQFHIDVICFGGTISEFFEHGIFESDKFVHVPDASYVSYAIGCEPFVSGPFVRNLLNRKSNALLLKRHRENTDKLVEDTMNQTTSVTLDWVLKRYENTIDYKHKHHDAFVRLFSRIFSKLLRGWNIRNLNMELRDREGLTEKELEETIQNRLEMDFEQPFHLKCLLGGAFTRFMEAQKNVVIHFPDDNITMEPFTFLSCVTSETFYIEAECLHFCHPSYEFPISILRSWSTEIHDTFPRKFQNLINLLMKTKWWDLLGESLWANCIIIPHIHYIH